MNLNHKIQDSLSYSGDQNNKLIEAALEGGALGTKLAGAGDGGTIIALTLTPEKTRRALVDAGAEMILGLDPEAVGVSVMEIENGEDEAAVR